MQCNKEKQRDDFGTDVQAYRRDGVIVVPDVLGAETLAEVRAVIAELVAGIGEDAGAYRRL